MQSDACTDWPAEWFDAQKRAEADRLRLHARKGIWSYICALCNHSMSRHSLDPDGDFHAGPYYCLCGCAVPLRGPDISVSKAGYEIWVREFGEPTSRDESQQVSGNDGGVS